MIDLNKKLEYDFLIDAIEKARIHQSKQLISFTKQVESVDPVKIFASFREKNEDRIFWGSTNDDFYLVGVGACLELNKSDKTFPELEEEVRQAMESAYIHNPFQTSGTGIVALGGKTFDINKRHHTLWDKFPHQSLRIPKWLITKDVDTYYCTVNMYVTEHDQADEVISKLQGEKNDLFTIDPSFGKIPYIQKETEIQPEQWKSTVKQAIEDIKSGEAAIQKVVLAREMNVHLSSTANIASMLDAFRRTQENSYIFAIEYKGDCFMGATPERLVHKDKEKVLSTCLAGTIRRGSSRKEDDVLKHELLNDQKNREEHDFVVNMIRGGLETYCDEVHIPDVPVIYQLKHLQHLYTPVRAVLKRGYHITDIVEALHPTPALGGVPRDKAMAYIREHEELERGWYGAPLGWFDSNRNGEFAVSIRSGLVKDDNISLFAGCGIMGESNPEAEYKETMIKFSPMLSVLEEKR